MSEKNKIFQFETRSNATNSLVLDTHRGFIEGSNPLSALDNVIREHNPYYAVIREPGNGNKIVAEYRAQ